MPDLESIKLLLKEAYFQGYSDNSAEHNWLDWQDHWEKSVIKRLIENDDNWKTHE